LIRALALTIALSGGTAVQDRTATDGQALVPGTRAAVTGHIRAPAPTRIRILARAPGCAGSLRIRLGGRERIRRVSGRRWRALTVRAAGGEHALSLRRGRCRVRVDRVDVLWTPVPGGTWHWQLSGALEGAADVFDVDLFETSAATVADIHARGARAVCYLSVGSFEAGRPDSGAFPAAVKGEPLQGWPGERWLDVRALHVLAPLLERRLDLCAGKGFDGVEADNVDGYANDTGFPLRAVDQLRFNRFLARAAHARGLSIALKNDLEQAADLEPDFDWALTEQCFQYRECDRLRPFTDAGKAVWAVEYELAMPAFCPAARALGFAAMRKRLELDAWREPCW